MSLLRRLNNTGLLHISPRNKATRGSSFFLDSIRPLYDIGRLATRTGTRKKQERVNPRVNRKRNSFFCCYCNEKLASVVTFLKWGGFFSKSGCSTTDCISSSSGLLGPLPFFLHLLFFGEACVACMYSLLCVRKGCFVSTSVLVSCGGSGEFGEKRYGIGHY